MVWDVPGGNQPVLVEISSEPGNQEDTVDDQAGRQGTLTEKWPEQETGYESNDRDNQQNATHHEETFVLIHISSGSIVDIGNHKDSFLVAQKPVDRKTLPSFTIL